MRLERRWIAGDVAANLIIGAAYTIEVVAEAG
jgi:hypothetical protein